MRKNAKPGGFAFLVDPKPKKKQYVRFNVNDFAAGTHDHWIVLMESLPETVFHAWKGRKMQKKKRFFPHRFFP